MKKVIVVGGGIAGLSAGIYACRSGFDVTVYEMHTIPGGNSTSWRRKGYLFEGGMHWLVGSGEKRPLHRLWKETGALKDNNPIFNKEAFQVYMDGKETISLYCDSKRLKEHLLEVSPEDKDAICQLIKDIDAFGKVSMPVMDVQGVRLKEKSKPPLAMLPALVKAMPRMKKLGAITAGEYADRFQHEGIRTILKCIVGNDVYSATSVAFTLGGLAAGDSGYPKGGSLRMAGNMADELKKYGGSLEFGKKVERIAVKDGKTQGVYIDETLHEADGVIVTVDTLMAVDKLFDEPLHEPWMDEMRESVIPLNSTFISIGVKADLNHLPESVCFKLKKPFTHGGKTYHNLGFCNYAGFEGYAPKGCTALTTVLMEDTYDEWKQAKEDGSYAGKKEELAEMILAYLEQLIPETKGNVEVWDVATPLTYERYCGTYRGSWMSVMTPDMKQQQYPLKSEQINNLYFAGQRTMLPGGLPVAVNSGRQAVQHLCKDYDVVFDGNA